MLHMNHPCMLYTWCCVMFCNLTFMIPRPKPNTRIMLTTEGDSDDEGSSSCTLIITDYPCIYRLIVSWIAPSLCSYAPPPYLLTSHHTSHLIWSLILNKTSERQDGEEEGEGEGEGERNGRSKNRPASTTSHGVAAWQTLRNINKVVSVIIEPLVIVNPFLNVGSGSLVPQPSSWSYT